MVKGQAPPNDSCGAPVILTMNTTCTSTAGDLANATNSGIPNYWGATVNDDVWYSFTCTSNNIQITLINTPGLNATFELFEGACGTNFHFSDHYHVSGDTLILTYNSTSIGSVYWVRVFTGGSAIPPITTFTLCVTDPGNNIAPQSLTYQNNDTIRSCHLGDTILVSLDFSSVEAGQITSVCVNLNGVANVIVLANTTGFIAHTQIRLVNWIQNSGMNIVSFSATDNGIPAATSYYNVIIYCDTTCTASNQLVWPGDANFDSVVTNTDLLPIGLFYSTSVSPRLVQGNLWQGDTATDTGISGPNAADIKHADCNGDGIIDANDTLAINLNFNLVHAISTLSNNQAKSSSPTIYFVTNNSSYNAGDMVDAEIWAGDAANPVSSLYGLAFTVNYTTALVQPGTENLTYPPSWIGTPGVDALKISKSDPLANSMYGAITRTNHIDANGYGKIADFKFQVKNNITSASLCQLSISNYTANDAFGAPVLFNTLSDSLLFVQVSAEVSTLNNPQSIVTISPNPFSNYTTITLPSTQQPATIILTDILGKQIRTIPHVRDRQVVIEKGEMKPGIYFLTLTTQAGVENRKIVVE